MAFYTTPEYLTGESQGSYKNHVKHVNELKLHMILVE